MLVNSPLRGASLTKRYCGGPRGPHSTLQSRILFSSRMVKAQWPALFCLWLARAAPKMRGPFLNSPGVKNLPYVLQQPHPGHIDWQIFLWSLSAWALVSLLSWQHLSAEAPPPTHTPHPSTDSSFSLLISPKGRTAGPLETRPPCQTPKHLLNIRNTTKQII